MRKILWISAHCLLAFSISCASFSAGLSGEAVKEVKRDRPSDEAIDPNAPQANGAPQMMGDREPAAISGSQTAKPAMPGAADIPKKKILVLRFLNKSVFGGEDLSEKMTWHVMDT